ncbi:MAG: Na+/H+ antiporter NhaA [Cytophagaceae bacterium]|jgi:NhaA family Na+:H+ antiporter|nr:Na+/H+ antiporter NhaA [Cytophagaceae bacterium]
MASFTPAYIVRIFNPLVEFFKAQQQSGYLLLIATALALAIANSPLGDYFLDFWKIPLTVGVGPFIGSFSLEVLINDGLMTIFFLVVGLEIKREMIEGALSTRETALLPVVGALGGMVAPACIFIFFNDHKDSAAGWGIPTATDIAFSLTVISLLGKRVPISLKVFLTALAVVDDLGAIVVIAFFYSHSLHVVFLMYAAGITLLLMFMNYRGVRNIYAYIFVGIFLWLSLHHAGVHATISGVVLAMTVPFRFHNYEENYEKGLHKFLEFVKLLETPKSTGHLERAQRDRIIEEAQRVSTTMESPLNNMLYLFSWFSSFIIMPLFALSNAGVKIDFNVFSHFNYSIGAGIFLGLILGKPLGITLFTWLTSVLKITRFEKGVSWLQIFCVNILAGIGFTMSIFVTNIAFTNPDYIQTAKISIIVASLLSGLLGYGILTLLNKSKPVSEP